AYNKKHTEKKITTSKLAKEYNSILDITNYLGGKFVNSNCQVIVSESSEILEINIKFYSKTKIKFRSIYIEFTQDVFFLRKFVLSGFSYKEVRCIKEN
ncbi:hypothetical protein BpHYR1_017432, partial [Brachionus plicatilis]